MSASPATSRRRRRGLSLVEAMIALAITAVLLTAIASAFAASASAMEINDQYYRASQAARVCMNHVLADVRQALAGSVDVHPSTVNLLTTTNQARSYSYDANGHQMLLTVTDINGTATYPLGSNMTALSFTGDANNLAISITVSVGSNSVTLSSSVVPRCTLVYQ